MIHFVYNYDRGGLTVGNYMVNACRSMGISCSWSDKLSLPKHSPNLLIKIDDGDYDPIKYKDLYDCPTVWWFVDSHTVFDRGLSIARNFDHTFCAQLEGVEKLVSSGIDAQWLPLGCDPNVHTGLFHLQHREYDIGFAGSITSSWAKDRQPLLNRISKEFKGRTLFTTTNSGQLSIVNGSSKIVINTCVNNDINMRFFEAISAGCILVTPEINNNGYDKMKKFKSIICYNGSIEDAIIKIKYALDNLNLLDTEAREASAYYQKHHCYERRMEELIKKT
jgi:hypothetical protein